TAASWRRCTASFSSTFPWRGVGRGVSTNGCGTGGVLARSSASLRGNLRRLWRIRPPLICRTLPIPSRMFRRYREEVIVSSANPQPVTIALDAAQRVSGLLQTPPKARVCYVMAHGAGAGMAHPLMTSFANHLAEHGIATFRYQFPYMERGSKRPDSPKLAHATVRAAVTAISR